MIKQSKRKFNSVIFTVIVKRELLHRDPFNRLSFNCQFFLEPDLSFTVPLNMLLLLLSCRNGNSLWLRIEQNKQINYSLGLETFQLSVFFHIL